MSVRKPQTGRKKKKIKIKTGKRKISKLPKVEPVVENILDTIDETEDEIIDGKGNWIQNIYEYQLHFQPEGKYRINQTVKIFQSLISDIQQIEKMLEEEYLVPAQQFQEAGQEEGAKVMIATYTDVSSVFEAIKQISLFNLEIFDGLANQKHFIRNSYDENEITIDVMDYYKERTGIDNLLDPPNSEEQQYLDQLGELIKNGELTEKNSKYVVNIIEGTVNGASVIDILDGITTSMGTMDYISKLQVQEMGVGSTKIQEGDTTLTGTQYTLREMSDSISGLRELYQTYRTSVDYEKYKQALMKGIMAENDENLQHRSKQIDIMTQGEFAGRYENIEPIYEEQE